MAATRAQYQISRASQLPTVNAQGGVTIAGRSSDVGTEYSVGVGATFELDLFGRVRSLKDAALEAYLSTEEARRVTHLALVGEVVAQYLMSSSPRRPPARPPSRSASSSRTCATRTASRATSPCSRRSRICTRRSSS